MKRVLINGLLLQGDYSGVQYSIEYLIAALSDLHSPDLMITVLVSRDYKGMLKSSEMMKLKRVPFSSTNRYKRILYENFWLPLFFIFRRFDLYHSPAYALPLFFNLPSIVTIHDLIGLQYPELCQLGTAIYFAKALPNAIKKANRIISVSHAVKADILAWFPTVNEKKIDVIYHGLHPRFHRTSNKAALLSARRRHDLPPNYLLFVGNLEPKKNLLKIIDAFCQLKAKHAIDQQLVIVGRKAWKYAPIITHIENNAWRTQIVLLNYVKEDDLPLLYQMADVLLFPSLYEGFGLPVLEAMACGCPVVVSNRGSLPEISGNFCPTVDPLSTDALADAIQQLLKNHDYREDLIQKGLCWSAGFTWKSSAYQTAIAYQNVTA